MRIPLPAEQAAALVALRPRAFGSESDLNQRLAAFGRQNRGLVKVLAGRRFPEDFIHVFLQFGNANRYIAPGVVLIGDAAHPVTPAGGQGANLVIADARCLADCLLQTSKPDLTRYEALRRNAANRSIWFSRRAAFAYRLQSRSPFSSPR